MKPTHTATIKTSYGNLKYNVVVIEQTAEKTVVQQVKKGQLYGPTFFADSIAAI